MTQPRDRTAEVRALVENQRAFDDDRPDPVGGMQRLCRAAADALPAAGVAVSLIADSGTQVTVAASEASVERIEELQFSLGEGPCLTAYDTRLPVLIPDLRALEPMPWPGYALAAGDHGVRAVFAFPLQIGGARLGAMDVYHDEAGALSPDALRLALTFAEVATATMLDAQVRPGARDQVVDDAVDNRYQVFQAQGMVMVQLGVSLSEAMVRIRGYAYAHNRRLSEVADDIVAGKLTFESDAP